MSQARCRRVFPLLIMCACGSGSAVSGPSAPGPADGASADQFQRPPAPIIDAGDDSVESVNGAASTGGAGGSASMHDAAASPETGTGGATGGRARCPALFCASFEEGAGGAPPDPASWTRTSMEIVVDSTRPARGGQKAAH